MCFSEAWSGTAFVVLVTTAAMAVGFEMNIRVPIVLLFFAVKELIQYMLYQYYDSCNESNRLWTSLSWIHISFQPFFVILLIQAFSKTPEMYRIPLGLALIFAVFNILRLKDLQLVTDKRLTTCVSQKEGEDLCRKQTCSTPGKYHIAYGFHLFSGDITWYIPNNFTYMLLTFAPALIIGDWQIPLANALIIIIARYLAPIHDGEFAAIWCLLAVVVVCLVFWSLMTGKKTF
jgi:hypothetical protein